MHSDAPEMAHAACSAQRLETRAKDYKLEPKQYHNGLGIMTGLLSK